MRLFLCVLSCMLLTASSSLAATVLPVQGTLSINRGQGFEMARSQTTAKVGDSIMVSPGGTATIVYDDGCRVDLRPDTVMTIASLSPCASGSYAQDNNNNDFNWGGVAMGVVASGLLGLGIYEAVQSPASP